MEQMHGMSDATGIDIKGIYLGKDINFLTWLFNFVV